MRLPRDIDGPRLVNVLGPVHTPGATAPVVGTGPNKLQGFENIYMGGWGY